MGGKRASLLIFFYRSLKKFFVVRRRSGARYISAGRLPLSPIRSDHRAELAALTALHTCWRPLAERAVGLGLLGHGSDYRRCSANRSRASVLNS